jgi:heme-degrading monooxygenase HmoA
VVPAAKRQQGFKSIKLLVERNTGKLQSISLWETEADVRATEEGSTYLQEQFAKFTSGTDVTATVESSSMQEQFARFISLYITPPVVTYYEVAVEA